MMDAVTEAFLANQSCVLKFPASCLTNVPSQNVAACSDLVFRRGEREIPFA